MRREEYLQNEREAQRRKIEREREKQRIAQLAMAQKRAAEEKERLNIIFQKEEQGRALQKKLKEVMQDEEVQMHALIQKQMEDDLAYEHYAISDMENPAGISEREITQKCDELFEDAPIKFQAREDSHIDQMLKNMIDNMRITIPIVWIKGSLYLIGINRINLEFKGEHIIAKIGGGFEKFELYISQNHRMLERQLIMKMMQSKKSLQLIVDCMAKGGKLTKDSSTLKMLAQEAS